MQPYISLHIDLQGQTPAYLQIMLQIQSLILREELLPGDQLPTVRQLASDLSINFNTVARAYRMLDQAGLITVFFRRFGIFFREVHP